MYKHITIAIITLFIVAATTFGSFWTISKPATSYNFGFPFPFLVQDYTKYGSGEVEGENFPITLNLNTDANSTRFPITFNANNFWLDYIIFLLLIELVLEISSIVSKKINS